MIAKAIETCWQLIIRYKTYFIHVHLWVLLHKFKEILHFKHTHTQTQCICVFCVDLSTHPLLLPYTALTDWFVLKRKVVHCCYGSPAGTVDGLLSQYGSGRYCVQPTVSRIFLGSTANSELVSKIALHCILHVQSSGQGHIKPQHWSPVFKHVILCGLV
jgi:hypothetical protein